VKDDDLRVLAQTAFRSPRSPLCVPQWIGDLALLPAPSFHAHDRVMHAGLIAWDNGWHLTEAGWKAIDAAAPKKGQKS
jgi:hypothetical protein